MCETKVAYCAFSVLQQPPDVNPGDFVFHEVPRGQKGEKGDDPVYLPSRSDVTTKGTFECGSFVQYCHCKRLLEHWQQSFFNEMKLNENVETDNGHRAGTYTYTVYCRRERGSRRPGNIRGARSKRRTGRTGAFLFVYVCVTLNGC